MDLSLRVSKLKLQGDAGRRLIDIPHLRVTAGSRVGICGPSGAGKTTLLHVLAGLADHASGEVHWGETELLSKPTAARARFRREHIGFVFQDFQLFDELDAVANAAILASFAVPSRRARIQQRAVELLAQFELDVGATVDHVQHIGRHGNRFSGGEQQRIAIARALANEPAILLADEPTASLSRHAADRMIDDLLQAAASMEGSLLVVSHDQRLLERMDRVLSLENGCIHMDSASPDNVVVQCPENNIASLNTNAVDHSSDA